MMKMKLLSSVAGCALLALGGGVAHATPVTLLSYDLAPYNGDGTLEATFAETGFSSSAMSMVGLPSPGFSNHFYTEGWSAGLDPAKYFTVTLSSASDFTLDKMLFSVESTGSASATVAVRSDLDAFSSDIDTFTWASSAVTNGEFDLASLGVLTAPIEMRFYFQGVSSNRLGFANHEVGGTGGGLSDVGRDIRFTGNAVSEPATLALMSAVLLCLVAGRWRRTAVS